MDDTILLDMANEAYDNFLQKLVNYRGGYMCVYVTRGLHRARLSLHVKYIDFRVYSVSTEKASIPLDNQPHEFVHARNCYRRDVKKYSDCPIRPEMLDSLLNKLVLLDQMDALSLSS